MSNEWHQSQRAAYATRAQRYVQAGQETFDLRPETRTRYEGDTTPVRVRAILATDSRSTTMARASGLASRWYRVKEAEPAQSSITRDALAVAETVGPKTGSETDSDTDTGTCADNAETVSWQDACMHCRSKGCDDREPQVARSRRQPDRGSRTRDDWCGHETTSVARRCDGVESETDAAPGAGNARRRDTSPPCDNFACRDGGGTA